MTWVSVKDRMPNDDEFVIEEGMCGVMIWGERSGYDIVWYNSPDEARRWLPHGQGASHWMPVPPVSTGNGGE